MLIIYVGYLSLGALIFVSVEADNEERLRNISLSNSHLIRSMVLVLRKENLTDEDISESFNQKSIQYNNFQNVTWKSIFGEKFIFSMIIITTIGYGNVRPASTYGKYACLIYAFFGVPLNVTMMRLISLQFRAGLRKMMKKGGKLKNSVYFDILTIFVYFIFFTTVLVFVPSFVFHVFDDWTYLESIYYCFVTLSTVGLGDYVSSVGSRHHTSPYYFLQVFLVFLWLLLGVTFIVMSLNLLSYLLGLLILDKLDCKCYKRSAARKNISAIYGCTTELNWQLAKEKPQNFNKWKILENFRESCVENPQDVTKRTLIDVLFALEELNDAIYEDAIMLDVPKKSQSDVASSTDYYDDIVKFRPVIRTSDESEVVEMSAYESAKDWVLPTIGSVPDQILNTSKSNESTQASAILLNKRAISEKQSSLKSSEESVSSEHSTKSPVSTKKAQSLTDTNINNEFPHSKDKEYLPSDDRSEEERYGSVLKTDHDVEDSPKSEPIPKPCNQTVADHQHVYKSAKDWSPPIIGKIEAKNPRTSKTDKSSKTLDSSMTNSVNSEVQSSFESSTEPVFSEQSSKSPERAKKDETFSDNKHR